MHFPRMTRLRNAVVVVVPVKAVVPVEGDRDSVLTMTPFLIERIVYITIPCFVLEEEKK
jgi:hypothetical protein